MKVVVVGGGFGGLAAAQMLKDKSEIDLTLIDRRNYHLFQPLLYQVATAGLSPAEIAVPIRSELARAKNTRVVLGEVLEIDLKNKTVHTEDQSLSFDVLLLACGAQHSYFGHSEWEENAPGLKTLEQATEIRQRILLAFERAENEKDREKQKALLTFVIVGGGPTGVELAGAIAEISRHTLERDFRNIDPSRTRVLLIEAGPRVLASFSGDLSKEAAAQLEEIGVQVWVNTRVTSISPRGVTLGSESVLSETVLWAAGVKPSSLGKKLACELDSLGRVKVSESLTIPDHENVFVIGDMACALDPQGHPYPGLAPVAIQQGRFVARQILRLRNQKSLQKFVYFDKGQMATIGRSKAVLQFRSLHLHGFIAWLAWLFIHVYYLIGFKNKIFVLFQWTWSYISFKKGARLIVSKNWKMEKSSIEKSPSLET